MDVQGISINQHQSESISINQHRWASISINQWQYVLTSLCSDFWVSSHTGIYRLKCSKGISGTGITSESKNDNVDDDEVEPVWGWWTCRCRWVPWEWGQSVGPDCFLLQQPFRDDPRDDGSLWWLWSVLSVGQNSTTQHKPHFTRPNTSLATVCN